MRIEQVIKLSKSIDEWHKISINLLYTSNFFRDKQQQFFKNYDLTMQQYNVLRILRGQYPVPVSINVVRDRLLDKSSDVSRIIDRLIIENWVNKKVSATDRRLVDIIISEKGLEVLKKIDDEFDGLTNMYQSLTNEEAIILNILLDKLRG